MNSLIKHIFSSLRYYWKSHLAIVIGVAICSMVLTGTLIVGDSIESSLEKSLHLRLGKTEYLFSGIDRYFSASLVGNLRKSIEGDASALLQLNGIGSSLGGKYKLNGVQVIGIDERFFSFIPGSNKSIALPEDEVYISENVAQRLQLKVGESFLLKIEKASQIPKNAPFNSEADNYISLRVKIGRVLGEDELGRFNLKTSQTAPYNIFMPLSFLNDKMDMPGKANRILFSGNNQTNEESLWRAIKDHWTLGDMSLGLYAMNNGESWEIRSDRIFIDEIIVKSIKQIDPGVKEILTYMVNSFKIRNRETPYSFLSAGPFMESKAVPQRNILINQWMAEDLGASIGDSIEVSYFVIGPLRTLSEEREWFHISGIVAIEGIYGEKDLMPNIPGLSDAGNCREWQTGVPVQLDKIRDKDEDYWKTYKGTPKAFIQYEDGKELWKNRFGECTAVRVSSENLSRDRLENQLSHLISPSILGYSLKSVKKEGITAAHGGVDFSQLFMGLSFFLMVAGLILMALLFNLHLENRNPEIGTLKALGYPLGLIRKIILFEGFFLAVPGVIVGGLLAILYNKFIFKALNTIWYDIVRTSILEEKVQVITLLSGMGFALALVFITMWFNVFKKLKKNVVDLQRKIHITGHRKNKFLRYSSLVSALIVVGLLFYEFLFSKTLNSGIFFFTGGILLLSFLLYAAFWLGNRIDYMSDPLSSWVFIQRNLFRNRARSLRIIILFSLGAFVIISTGLNKKDLHSGADLPTSGTGGFLYYMETTLPILKDLSSPENKPDLTEDIPVNIVQLRKIDGDDASCLNLNRISAPRILGIPAEKLTGRFSFVQRTSELDVNDPWSSLETRLEDNVIPALADQTVIQWGLGKEVGDTLVYLNEFGKEMKLKIIGGLANSIFQGNLIIDENLLLEHYPSNSGSHILLIDGPFDQKGVIADQLSRVFRNEGIEMEFTVDRLASFNRVENTYLSIFLMLGGLALILGTFGLGIVLVRNIMDRTQEIGILQAMGYRDKEILKLITLEHGILLIVGTLFGTMAAFVAILPSLVSEFVDASWQTALIIIFLILINGILWIFLITRKTLHNDLYVSLRTE